MRGQRATGFGLGVIVVVGATTTASGAFTDGGEVFRFRGGMVLLLMGLAGLVTHRSHCNTTRLIEHQTKLAAMTLQQQQVWAERGYRAGQMDVPAAPVHAVSEDDFKVLPMPVQRSAWWHRNGA